MDENQKREGESNNRNRFDSLRIKAEKFLEKDPEVIPDLDIEQIRELVHELKVHQIELEMQNESLQQARDELEKVRDQYADLYDNAPVGYISSTPFGVVLRANQTFVKMLNTQVSKIVNSSLGSWCVNKDAFYLHCRSLMNKGKSSVSEIQFKRTDGGFLFASIESSLVESDRPGSEPEIRSIITNISEKKLLEDQLRQAQKMETVGTLTGGIAHEFNNLLQIIIGNNEMVLENTPDDGNQRERLEEIYVAADRGRNIVRQLLTFTRQSRTIFTAMDLAEVTKETIKLIRATMPVNIEIRLKLPESRTPIFGDSNQITQLLINLCANARDALFDQQGVIEVELAYEELSSEYAGFPRTLPRGKYCKLMVRDNGCGMDKSTLDRIFDPYFTTKEIDKGTGLGLAIVLGIVNSHKGVITVGSEPGKGSRFTMLFPFHDGRIEEKPEAEPQLETGHERILLIDDEAPIVKMGKKRLERLGYKVQGFTNPIEALGVFKSDPDAFDLVITDMAMPHMTGDQFLAEIHRIRPKMPNMLCTGYSERISEEKICELGVWAVLLKPVNKSEFAQKVRQVLDTAEGGA